VEEERKPKLNGWHRNERSPLTKQVKGVEETGADLLDRILRAVYE
jgi:hypothetical protein